MHYMFAKPLTIVVFGATGDLFEKKLAHALFDLFRMKFLSASVRLVGFSRKPLTHEEFRVFARNAIHSKAHGHDEKTLDDFLAKTFYHAGDLSKAKSYEGLGRFLAELDRKDNLCSDKLFYLAIPPHLYQMVFKRLAASGLAIACAPGVPDERAAWTRVLVEKPFGNNLKEARKLDRLLGKLFAEEQIFRIDHYLAKETIQNIISFRFSNGLFESLWDRYHIERVEIKMLEKNAIGTRGKFYEGVGALRDVGQNHILQMLALIAMENPKSLAPEVIRSARASVLKKVVFDGEYMRDFVIRGQYEGYRSEGDVALDSGTETYFKLKAFINNSRWKGVPFILESGKALSESKTEIVVYFKPTPCLCPGGHEKGHQNILTFSISPKESISVRFWAKRPGFEFSLEPKELSFSVERDELSHEIPEAYERVLFDCIRGDQTLFTSTEEVAAEWKIIMPILDGFKDLQLLSYPVGSAGPLGIWE